MAFVRFCTVALFAAACGSTHSSFGPDAGHEDGGTSADGGVAPSDGGPKFGDAGASDAMVGIATCADATKAKSYVGCDYWPTVTGNNVWSIFDYAVVVANAGNQPAQITITGPSSTSQTATVPPGALQKFYLPWVKSLKGPDSNGDGLATPMTASVVQKGGAYHLVSDVPVSVYQFNALEYKPAGGPPNKDWSACPNDSTAGIQCFSYSNDASLLLPSTAMTNNYRVMGQKGWSNYGNALMGPSFSVTATENGTVVTVKTSASSQVLSGGGIPAQSGVGQFTIALDAGDVAEIVGQAGDQNDLSGSLVTAQDAQHPVQVISSMPCVDQPTGTAACDHVEESVFPAETLGQHYFVTVPTGPNGDVVGHIVRFFGNVDGTTLTYSPSKPTSCPQTLNAGDVVDCGMVTSDFEVKGNNAFGIFSGMLGGQLLDPGNYAKAKGDPSQSFTVAVEQYRTAYIFLAPSDYDVSYVDVVGPVGANVMIDGSPITSFTPISNGFGVSRFLLGAGNQGAHQLASDKPVGIQVMGYGQYTSYQYPGGSDLVAIAPPPVK